MKNQKYLFWGLSFILLVFISSCEMSSDIGVSDTGTGGSLSRFAIVENHMYVVDNNYLRTFSLENPEEPKYLGKTNVGFSIETIYAVNDLLFIGSGFGVYVYDVSVAEKPALIDESIHVRSCDPVVADENYAFVTLRSGSQCGGGADELQVLDVSEPTDIILKKSYPMDNPKGLAIHDDLLFLCDRSSVKVFNKSDVNNLVQVSNIPVVANDIIVLDTLLIMITNRELVQYSFVNGKAKYLSELYKIDD